MCILAAACQLIVIKGVTASFCVFHKKNRPHFWWSYYRPHATQTASYTGLMKCSENSLCTQSNLTPVIHNCLSLLCCFPYLTLELQSARLHFYQEHFTSRRLESSDARSWFRAWSPLPFCLKFCFDSLLSPEITFVRSVNSFMFIIAGQGCSMSLWTVFNGLYNNGRRLKFLGVGSNSLMSRLF